MLKHADETKLHPVAADSAAKAAHVADHVKVDSANKVAAAKADPNDALPFSDYANLADCVKQGLAKGRSAENALANCKVARLTAIGK